MTGADVNVPTNTKIKEQDVNAKLQLYGIYSAFANGKVPSNKQIDVALSTITKKKFLATPSKRLSPEGQKLVGDFRDVVEKAKLLLLSKNEGNVIQDFIWQTQQITGNNASTPNAPLDKATAQQHGDQALDGLRTLGSLLISNGQFRKLLNDVVILARDIAGDAAQKAAAKVNPSDDELRQIDHPAEDNTWHENPDMSKEGLKQQWNDRKPFSKQDVQNTADKAYNRAEQPDGSIDPTQAAQTAKVDLHQTANQQTNPEDRERAEDAKNTAREYRDRTSNYLKDKVPEERRDQTIWRLKKMVAEIQGHQDYQQAIDTLLRLAEEYAGHGKNLANQSVGTVQEARGDSALQKAEYDLKTIIERFANSTSLDDLFESINQIYQDADRDPELKDWFKKVDRFIRRSLQEQGYILQDAATDEWNKLYDHGNFLLRERYRNHTDRILDEFKFYSDQFDQDSQNKAFGQAVNKLFLDLGNDENGKATFKPHLVKDLTDVILPAFFENIRYVPIPRIEFRDPTVDLVIENLVVEGDNLAPNVFEFGSDNYWRWGRKQNASKNKNKVMLAVSGIQCDLRDVSFYVKKKDGFPAITDKGLMDVKIGGSGVSFKVAMETADDSDKAHFFKVNKVDVSLKNVSINLKQSNHKLLFKLFKPLLLKVMNPVLQKVIEKQVRDNIHQLDATLYSIHKEAEKAKARVKENPEEAENFYQRYTQAINDRITQAKQKKAEVQSKNEVNVAVTQHDSIFPDIKLPGGISTKATEYKELAAKGDKWESPIFSIGSASESTNIPKLASVTRKPHNVTQGGLRGGVGNTPGYAGQPGQNFTNQVNQAGPNSTGQSGYTGQSATSGLSSSQPGYSAGQSGYSAGQPGYTSGVGSSAQSGLTSSSAAHPSVGSTGHQGGLTGQSLGANQPGVVNQTVGTGQPGLTGSSVPGTNFGSQVDNAFNTHANV